MIRIDDSLLEELGLIALPEADRKELLTQIYRMLEERVGMRLAEQMSEQQLSEFERFVDGDNAYVEQYLNVNRPGWQQTEAYLTTLKGATEASVHNGQQVDEASVKAEFAALSWLENNFPNYKDVVADELSKLKTEIKQDSARIIETVSVQQQAQALQVPPTDQQPPLTA